MRAIDELHLEYPFLGARQLSRILAREGHPHAGRLHVGTLMAKMGITALYRKPNTRAGVAGVEHADRRLLCRGGRRSDCPLRPTRNLQHRPGHATRTQLVVATLLQSAERSTSLSASAGVRQQVSFGVAAAGEITFSWNGCGARSNTKRFTCTHVRASARQRPASGATSSSTTVGDRTPRSETGLPTRHTSPSKP